METRAREICRKVRVKRRNKEKKQKKKTKMGRKIAIL
jgi:hypothetical protein